METVKVAVRIRPLVNTEIASKCSSCIERLPDEPKVSIGMNNQMFTFDYVFDENEEQEEVYNVAVAHLINNLFKGYNLTILAYGQTGSGKSYTMGTNGNEVGVIPRAVDYIFDMILDREEDTTFSVSVSFLELYNEELYDLLTDKPRDQSIVDMREVNNGICIPGLTELTVENTNDALVLFEKGSKGRVVGATAMNSASSRSHAVFTINLKITNEANPEDVMASKFHFVDLAGSGMSKRTQQAAGDWFQEEVNIKKGLMTLGCVISQLCDGLAFNLIDYRDSKLTRLLQDSLGGNSVTLMIACVSPADYNLEESARTLLYADRAKKIKNKPVVNKDPASAEISRFRKENEELRMQLHVLELRMKIIGNGLSWLDYAPGRKKLEDHLRDALQKNNKLSDTLLAVLKQSDRSVMADKLEETLNEKHNVIDSMLDNTQQVGIDIWKTMRSKITEMNEFPLVGKDPHNSCISFTHSLILILPAADERAERVCIEQERVGLDQKAQQVYDCENEKGPVSPSSQEHILAQAEIDKEIYTITQSLVWKEELLANLRISAVQLREMAGRESIEELRWQIAELREEKDELQEQSKVSEQRRKRLQELVKVASLMKKVTEQEGSSK